MKNYLTQLLSLLAIISIHFEVIAQGDDVSLINGRPIDPFRYESFRGSPYLFKDWQKGNIITNDFHTFHDITLNYNGNTHEFEVRRKDEFIELDTKYYMRIQVPQEGGDTLLFQRGIHPKFPNRFFEICHLSKHFILIKDFEAEPLVQSVNLVAGIEDVKKFATEHKYYLNYEGRIQNVFLNKRKVISILKNKKVIDEIISSYKLNLKKEDDFVSLLSHLEEEYK